MRVELNPSDFDVRLCLLRIEEEEARQERVLQDYLRGPLHANPSLRDILRGMWKRLRGK